MCPCTLLWSDKDAGLLHCETNSVTSLPLLVILSSIENMLNSLDCISGPGTLAAG
jgi:hypothetical protein